MNELEKKIISAFNKFETEVNFESTDLMDEIFEIYNQLKIKHMDEKIEMLDKMFEENSDDYGIYALDQIKNLQSQKSILEKQ